MVLVLAYRLVNHALATGLVVGLSMRLVNRLVMLLFYSLSTSLVVGLVMRLVN